MRRSLLTLVAPSVSGSASKDASVPREQCLVIAALPVSARELTAPRDGRVATIPTRADLYMRGCLVQAWFRQPLLSGMERARWEWHAVECEAFEELINDGSDSGDD